MDLTLYQLLTQPMNPKPDLSLVQERQVIPEDWPVVLERIQVYRKQLQHFTVTDGQSPIICVSRVPDLYDRIAATELGTIIHLMGAQPVLDKDRRRYILQVEDFLTLKQYDEKLAKFREAEQKRQEKIRQDEAFYQSAVAGPES